MRSSNGNINQLSVVSEYADRLDEAGDAPELFITGGRTDENVYRAGRRSGNVADAFDEVVRSNLIGDDS